MTTVTVPIALGGDGAAFSDAGESARDMQGQGYAANFFPLLGQVIPAISLGVSAANSAITAPGTMGTSSTSLTIGTGAKSLTTQTGKSFAVGQRVVIAYTTTPTTQMTGIITSYTTGTGALNVTIDDTLGSGTYGAWTVALQGKPGASGVIGRTAVAGATTLDGAHRAQLVDVTSGTFTLAFAAAASIGAGWSCLVRNAGTGDVTLDPAGAETIDGLTSFVLYPGAARLVTCDGTAFRSVPLVGGTKVFTTSANFVWAPGISQWLVDVIGAGAGGGGGARSGARYNGGGGGAGERLKTFLAASQIAVGGTTSCSVGAKGVGGAAAATDNTSGSDGGSAGDSVVTGLVTAHGGSGVNTRAVAGANHGVGAAGGGSGVSNMTGANQSSGLCAPGQTSHLFVSVGASAGPTEWAGPSGRAGDTVTSTRMAAVLGGQTSGRGGAYVSAGTAGANGTNPGDAGDGGGGNVNGSAAGKGGDGVDGKITITEVI